MAKMMFDMQKLVDAMGDAARAERSNYHLTLGAAIAKLEAMDAALPVICSDDTSSAPGYAMSYRGYYSDLAFAPVPATDVGAFLATCKNALDTTKIEKRKRIVAALNGQAVVCWTDEQGKDHRRRLGVARVLSG